MLCVLKMHLTSVYAAWVRCHCPPVPTLHLKQVDSLVSSEYVQPLQLHLPGIGSAVRDTHIQA